MDFDKRQFKISQRRKNLNASILFAIVMLFYFLIDARKNNFYLYLSGFGILWHVYELINWIRLRRRLGVSGIKRVSEIIRDSKRDLVNSYLFVSILIFGCLLLLGYLTAYKTGMIFGLYFGIIYLLDLLMIEMLSPD